MRLKTGFMLREIANQWIVVPLGQRTVEFNAIMNLSETGAIIWKGLEQTNTTEQILMELIDKYEVDYETAQIDFNTFVSVLKDKGILENE